MSSAMNGLLFTLRCVTPMSIGAGVGSGPIDRPVHREAASDTPPITPEAIKSALKRRTRPGKGDAASWARWKNLFGREEGDDDFGSDDGGLLKPQQGMLLALPVPSPEVMRVWVTCTHVLWQLKDLCRRLGVSCPDVPAMDVLSDESSNVLGTTSMAEFCKGGLCVGPHEVGYERQAIVDEWADWIVKRFFDEDQVSKAFGEQLARRFIIAPGWLFHERMRRGLQVKTRTAMRPDTRIVQNMWNVESVTEGALYAGAITFEPRGRLPFPDHPVTFDQAAAWLSGADLSLVKGQRASPVMLDIGGLQGVGHTWTEVRFHCS
jgi:CRISPR type III-B/RAMP module RAMP protein Cmr4